LRGFLFEIVPPAASQTIRFSIHRQDGARYAVNTLGHSFARPAAKMGASAEDIILNMTKQIANNPSLGIKSGVMQELANFADGVSSVLAGTAGTAALASMLAKAGQVARPLFGAGGATAAVNAMKLMI